MSDLEEVRVWADIIINGRAGFHIISNGYRTPQRNRDEILSPFVDSYAEAIRDNCTLKDPNPHRDGLVNDILNGKEIIQMGCPTCSPETNPCLRHNRQTSWLPHIAITITWLPNF